MTSTKCSATSRAISSPSMTFIPPIKTNGASLLKRTSSPIKTWSITNKPLFTWMLPRCDSGLDVARSMTAKTCSRNRSRLKSRRRRGLGAFDLDQTLVRVADQPVEGFEPLLHPVREQPAAIGADAVIDRSATCDDRRARRAIFDPLGVGLHQIEFDRHERADADIPSARRKFVEETARNR